MSAPAPGAAELAATIESAADRLGLDAGPDLARVREFLAGPPVVAVAGLPHAERTDLAAGLAEGTPEASVLETDLRPEEGAPLWDVLVVVTPADRVLSQAEEALVAEAVAQRRPVLVVVSRTHVLGDDRDGAIGELERFRLRPTLGPSDVRWHFEAADPATGQARAAIVRDVADRLAMIDGHERATLAALRTVLDGLLARTADVVATRDREREQLAAVERELPAIRAHLREQARAAGPAVADRLRSAEDDLYDATTRTAEAAAAWSDAGGLGPWDDVSRPLVDAWQRVVEQASSALSRQAAAVRDVQRRAAQRIADGLLPVAPAVVVPEPSTDGWEGPALREALDRLAAVELEPVLTRLEQRARQLAPAEPGDRTGTGDETGAGAGKRTPRAVVRQSVELGRRLGEELQKLRADPARVELAAQLLGDLAAVTGNRLAEVREAARAAAAERADAEADAAATALQKLVAGVSDELTDRHAWFGAYGELLGLRSRV